MRKKWALSRRRRIVFYLSIGVSCPSLVFGWHVFLSLDALRTARAYVRGCGDSPVEFVSSVEPVADLVTLRPVVARYSTYDDMAAIEEPDAAVKTAVVEESGALVAQQISLMARRMQPDVPLLEDRLNDSARNKLDLYAMVLPYKVKISLKRASSARKPDADSAAAD
jgi:hypothetical protein